MRILFTRIGVFLLTITVASHGLALDAGDAMKRAEDDLRLANPIRPKQMVMETRPAGRSYLTQVNVKLEGRASHADWGLGGGGNVTFAASMAYKSDILENDGLTVVERRAYQTMAGTLVAGVDRMRFQFLNPRMARDTLIYFLASEWPGAAPAANRAMDWILGELGVTLTEKDIQFNEKIILTRKDRQLFVSARLDSIAGKTFLITYRNDGTGIQTVEPEYGAAMLPEEERLIRGGCYLFDAAFLGDEVRKEGDRWTINAGVFGNLLAGALHGQPTGQLGLVRRPDQRRPDATGEVRDHIMLEIEPATTADVTLRQLVRREQHMTYEESGKIRGLTGQAQFIHIPADEKTNRPTEMYLHLLRAKGLADLQTRSRDHLLFEARFEASPTVEIEYLSFPVPTDAAIKR